MFSGKIKKAFTLIELLVWIAIISILIIWATSIDYNRLSNKQKLELFTNSIKSNFETIRNSSLAWKWIWPTLEIPKKWKIDYSNTNSWTIISSISLDWNIWTNNEKIKFDPWYYISQIKCFQLDWLTEDDEIISWTWTIEFEWINITLAWDCNANTSKILELSIKNNTDTKKIQFNTLNWLAEIK
jgi:prepilin-type N-terminal cleavage/methylation domain-containing protein